ncbi:hypothetical protein IB292_02615 [Vibrio parahaemolyticus]|uniref:Uncharacterized protein n=1 Tax=Vibrio parahaemolyticus TaxID=670 RepID=A0A9Q3YHV0_VIBPH|nr:hypothetical protein [Vibrio parahaemolyticus]MCC3803922.1 hypothetical protein [Vibrio parahaemolyticus]
MFIKTQSISVNEIPAFVRSALKFVPAILLMLCHFIAEFYTISEQTESMVIYAIMNLLYLSLAALAMMIFYYASMTLLLLKIRTA